MNKPEIKKDLITILVIVAVFAVSLVFIKIYDKKTNEITKIGEKILHISK